MILRLSAVVWGLACLGPLQGADVKPVVDSPEGQRAFTDLTTFYTKSLSETFAPPAELAELNSPDQTKAQKAGDYMLALFEQSWADETNGRTDWRPVPFWGGGSDNRARTFRGQLAEAFGETAASPAALPAAMWLIEHDLVEDDIGAGAQALPRIRSATADDVIGALLKEQHPSEQVLLMALHEAALRHLTQDKESVVALEQSCRSAVRKAAQEAAVQLGEAHAQDYDRNAPLSPRLLAFLKTNSERLLTPVPENATWELASDSYSSTQGWVQKETSTSIDLLDWFARENSFLKKINRLRSGTLQEAADDLIARRAKISALQASAKDNHDDWQKVWEERGGLSREGTLTSQFEPGFISLPEITVALWCWQRGDLGRCRQILDGCYSASADDRWLDMAARDYLGNTYHLEMVHLFCNEQDDAAALRLAEHLSKPIFDGYNYQNRAKDLAAQLTRKDADSNLQLPPLPAWWVLQAFLSRDQQITYLAKRLKLLHTEQDMQPGDVYYDSPMPDSLSGIYCINPYLELRRLDLTNHDFIALAPFASDRDYTRTYSYFRGFHPSRNLHRVCELVEQLVNDTAAETSASSYQKSIMQRLQEGTRESFSHAILSRAADGSVYFTAKPDADVVVELRNWAQAQPARGFLATWWQTPTALLVSYWIFRRYRYRLAHPKPPRRPLFFSWWNRRKDPK